jgi:hypothetical protein
MLGHINPELSPVTVVYQMGHCRVTVDSVVGHFALLGVTHELASQWDDYVYEWCQEYILSPG